MNKHNTDGSVKLGTLRLESLLTVAKKQLTSDTDKKALDELESLIEDSRKSIKDKALKVLDEKVMVLLDPNSAQSEQNPEVKFELESVVVYIKRKNPTRTVSAAQARKQAFEAATAKAKQLHSDGELNDKEFADVLVKLLSGDIPDSLKEVAVPEEVTV